MSRCWWMWYASCSVGFAFRFNGWRRSARWAYSGAQGPGVFRTPARLFKGFGPFELVAVFDVVDDALLLFPRVAKYTAAATAAAATSTRSAMIGQRFRPPGPLRRLSR